MWVGLLIREPFTAALEPSPGNPASLSPGSPTPQAGHPVQASLSPSLLSPSQPHPLPEPGSAQQGVGRQAFEAKVQTVLALIPREPRSICLAINEAFDPAKVSN